MSTLRFTEADRDEQGRIRVEPPAGSRFAAPTEAMPADLPAEPQPRQPMPRPPIQQDGSGAGSKQTQRATIASGMVVLFVVLAVVSRLFIAPTGQFGALPTSAPAGVTAAPAYDWTTPTATTIAYQTTHAAVAYAAPNGDVIGALEPGRGFVPVGRFGDEWVQLDVRDSGRVWVKRADVSLDVGARSMLDTLPDLAPPTPAPTRTAVPTSAPVYVAPTLPPAPQATPLPPTVCAENLYGRACGWGNVQATADAIKAEAEATSAARRATLEAQQKGK